ncbi:lipoyl(octanoyl) transferase LipB [Lapillicoccus sp.]|uniref:lipoyl(octanoyl) transferase LipB n=1 Tax=Lapillicoccus sp. TaxID=1909287 RepID=UPI0025D60F8A|nr:lipoyl(octanoyl) transferase LipB [Lapillicoccus sp.]
MQFVHVGWAPEPVDYQQGWDLQREVHARVVAGEQPDTTLLLEHAAVYTAGKRTQPQERPQDGTPVIDVDRGGKITWHGPGQLVAYPIVRLPAPIDVVAHVRRLEEVMIRVCADFGVTAGRREGDSGAWVLADDRGPDRKVGAIGIRVSRQVTMHGFALNCDPDLSWADVIVPCGIADAGVTSISREVGRDVSVADVLPRVEVHLGNILDPYAVSPSRANHRGGLTP